MMRRLLLLLLALGLWQIACAQLHCGLEPPDCQEGACDFCHLVDISQLATGSTALWSPLTAPSLAVAPNQGAADQALLRHNRGRAPPR